MDDITRIDDFNEEGESKTVSNPHKVEWKDEDINEAVCAVCDEMFNAPADRPPIFCPDCKAALKHTLNK